MEFKGRKYVILEEDGEKVIRKTKEFKEFQESTLGRIKVTKSSLPPSVIDYDISQYKGDDVEKNLPKIKQYIEDFSEKYKSINLYIWSKQGSRQKSTVMGYIGKSILLQGFSVEFILMDNLIKILQDTFSETREETISKYRDCDLLLVDDAFSKEKVTLYKSKYQLSFIDSFFRERLEVKKKATIFTSNIPVNEIMKEGFGESIENLVTRNCYTMHFTDMVKESFVLENLWS